MSKLRHFAALVALPVAGCFPTLSVGEAADIRCTSDSECPPPMACQQDAGRCALPGVVFDTTPPFITGAQASVSIIGADGNATVTLSATEPLASAQVRIEGDDLPFDISVADRTITATISGAGRVAGAITLVATAVDVAGNTSTETRLAAGLTIDPDAPDIVTDAITIHAGPDNVLFPATTDAARADSVVDVEVEWTEPSTSRTELSVDNDRGEVFTIDVDLGAADATRTNFTLDADVLAGVPDGTWTLSIRVQDAVGNAARRSLATPLVIDTTPPSSPTLSLLTRAPFGSDVASPRTSGSGRANDALLVLGVPADVVVDPTQVPASVARAVVTDGVFSFAVGLDVPGLQAVAVDEAGNLSAAVSAERTALVASTLVASTPHELRARPIVSTHLLQRGDVRVDDALRSDGRVTTKAAVAWRPLTTLTKDSFGGAAVLAPDPVGGGLIAVANGFTFRVANAQVVRLDVPRLPMLAGTQLATDPRRGRIVVFGGRDATDAPRNDLLEWDGRAWSTILTHAPSDQTRPAPREGHGMTFVPSLGGVVVVGGCAGEDPDPSVNVTGCDFKLPFEVWNWDGRDFEKLCSGATCGTPPPPMHPALTFDAGGSLVAAGGSSDEGVDLIGPGAPRVFRFVDGSFTGTCGDACGAKLPPDVVGVFDGVRAQPAFFGTCESGPCVVHVNGETSTLTALSAPILLGDDLVQPRGVAIDDDGRVVLAAGETLVGIDGPEVGTVAPRTLQARCGGAALVVDGEVQVLGGCGECSNPEPTRACNNPLDSVEAPAASDVVRGTSPVVGLSLAVPLDDDTVVISETIGASSTAVLRRSSDLATPLLTLDLGRNGYISFAFSADGSDAVLMPAFLDDLQFPPSFGMSTPPLLVDGSGAVTDGCSNCGNAFTDGRGTMVARTRGNQGVLFGGDVGGSNSAFTQLVDGSGQRSDVSASIRPLGRRFGSAVWDAERDWTWLVGGTSSTSGDFPEPATCGVVGGSAECGDLWRFDGAAWEQLQAVDVNGFGEPPARTMAQATSDGGGLVLSGGIVGTSFFTSGARRDAWRLDASSTQAMGHQLLARYAAYGADAQQAFDGISVHWCGSANDAAGAQVGVVVRVWAGGRWHDTTQAKETGCISAELSTAGVEDLVVDDSGDVFVEVLPLLAATGGTDPSLTTTKLSVTTFFAR